MKRLRAVSRCGVVILGCLFGLLLLIPQLGRVWHWFHGDAISHQGWRIPVPNGFLVRTSSGGPNMWNVSFGRPLWDSPYAHISFFKDNGDHPLHYDQHHARFAAHITEAAATQGYEFFSTQEVSVADTKAYCWEFRKRSSESELRIRCFIEGTTVLLFYEGDRRFVPDFFTVLGGMSRQMKESGASGRPSEPPSAASASLSTQTPTPTNSPTKNATRRAAWITSAPDTTPPPPAVTCRPTGQWLLRLFLTPTFPIRSHSICTRMSATIR